MADKDKQQRITNNLAEIPELSLTIVRGSADFCQEQVSITSRTYHPEDCVRMFNHALDVYNKLNKKQNANNKGK